MPKQRQPGNHRWECRYNNEWAPAKGHEALTYLGAVLGDGQGYLIKLGYCKCGVNRILVKSDGRKRMCSLNKNGQGVYYVYKLRLSVTPGPCTLNMDGID
jgi:hypothetical protein